MVVALVALAVADLVVGVSNDAVNFLNSALGSKVLSFRTIMIVASIGIFVGCVFSSGMMEVARKGIFNPGEFYFNEIMYKIYLGCGKKVLQVVRELDRVGCAKKIKIRWFIPRWSSLCS